MKTVIGLFDRADQAREALEDLVEFGASQEQITLLAHRDGGSAFDRVMTDYRIRTNGASGGDERALLIITVISTFDASHALNMMLQRGALTVASRSKVWPHTRVHNLG